MMNCAAPFFRGIRYNFHIPSFAQRKVSGIDESSFEIERRELIITRDIGILGQSASSTSALNAQGMGAQELRVQPVGPNTLSC